MSQFDQDRAPIESLQEEMGKALAAAIDKQGGKVAFAERAGLNRATLYRLLRGENVSTDVLLRTLRTLGRSHLIAELIAPPLSSPLELRPPTKSKRKSRSQVDARATKSPSQVDDSAPGPPSESKNRRPRTTSLVNQLTLGRLPGHLSKDERDG